MPRETKRQFRKVDDGWLVSEFCRHPTLYPNLKTALVYMWVRDHFGANR